MGLRGKCEVAYWPNPPGGLPTLRYTLRGRSYEFPLPSRGWLSLMEVAAVLGTSDVQVWRWVQGDKPRFRVRREGRRWWVSASDLARYLDRTGAPAKGIFLGTPRKRRKTGTARRASKKRAV